jgi:hypothetical protein
MARSARRVRLGVDCLEDRHAPAMFTVSGLSVGDAVIAPALNLDARAAGQFAVAAMPAPDVAPAPGSDVPFGFFHPFCQSGFGGGDVIFDNVPVPLPRPVMPPLDPSPPVPALDLADAAMPVAPAAAAEAAPSEPAPLWRGPMPEIVVPILEPPPAQRVNDTPPSLEAADNSLPVTPARAGSRHGVLAVGGLTAYSTAAARASAATTSTA